MLVVLYEVKTRNITLSQIRPKDNFFYGGVHCATFAQCDVLDLLPLGTRDPHGSDKHAGLHSPFGVGLTFGNFHGTSPTGYKGKIKDKLEVLNRG